MKDSNPAPHMVSHTIFISNGITLFKSLKEWMKNNNMLDDLILLLTFVPKAKHLCRLNKKELCYFYLFFWHIKGEGDIFWAFRSKVTQYIIVFHPSFQWYK